MSNLLLWSRRHPFAEFDELVRRAFGTPIATWPAAARTGFVPAAEVSRDGEDAIVRIELPGVDVAKDVTVEKDGNRLVVRGERRDERTEEQGRQSLREVRYGSFRRTFTLPADLAADAITASYDAGVLSLRLAGAYTGSGARRIPVTSGEPTPAVSTGDNAGHEAGDEAPEQPAA